MNTTTTVVETAIHIVALVVKGTAAPYKGKRVRAVAIHCRQVSLYRFRRAATFCI